MNTNTDTGERTAHWIVKKVKQDQHNIAGEMFSCSACGREWGYGMTEYCPRCGKHMIEEVVRDDQD